MLRRRRFAYVGFVICVVLFLWTSVGIVSASEPTIIYLDDFDSYSIGITPPDWVVRFSGASHVVSSDQSYSSPNSFKLVGHQSGNCVMSYPIEGIQSDSELWFESYVMATDLATNNLMGFSTGSNNPVYGSVSFTQLGSEYVIASGAATRSFTPNTWYKVNIYLNLQTRTFDSWIDDEILAENAPIEAGLPEQITITSGNAIEGETIWYDGVKIELGIEHPVPEFPSIFLPATMIIGFLGAVLLIRRTKEH